MRNPNTHIRVLFLALLIGFILTTCADKILEPDDSSSMKFELKVNVSASDATELVDIWEVSIESSNPDTTIVDTLNWTGGKVSGRVDGVPAGTDLLVTLRGLHSSGVEIYAGSSAVIARQGATTAVSITLQPIAKLLRVSPRSIRVVSGKPETAHIKVNNLPGLTVAEFRIECDGLKSRISNVIPGSGLPANVNWTASDSGSFCRISVSSTNPIVDAAGNATLATFEVTPLPVDSCNSGAELTLSSLNMPDGVFVDHGDLFVTNTRLRVNAPDTLRFFAGPGKILAPVSFTVSDVCGKPPVFDVAVSQAWLSGVPSQQPGSGLVTASVDTAGMSPGVYFSDVEVNCNSASNSPIHVPVKLAISAATAQLAAVPSALTFNWMIGESAPAEQTMLITEPGDRKISFTISDVPSWLVLTSPLGITPRMIGLSIDTVGLSEGTYNEVIRVVSNEAQNSPLEIPVALTVLPEHYLAVSPTTAPFNWKKGSPLPAAVSIEVRDTVGGVIPYSFEIDVDWLTVTAPDLETPAIVQIGLNGNVDALDTGLYTGIVTFQSDSTDNSPTFSVNLDITAASEYMLQIAIIDPPMNYSKGDSLLPSVRMVISELNNAGIPFTVRNYPTWLQPDKLTGLTTDTVMLRLLDTSLAVGSYVDTIEVVSDSAVNSPQRAGVSCQIEHSPTDTIPPSEIMDLTASILSRDPSTNVRLEWTAPGDDGITGTAAAYDIRYSYFPLDTSNWLSGLPVLNPPLPLPGGTTQTVDVAGLPSDSTIYFYVRTADDSSNWSGPSNPASVGPDTTITIAGIVTDAQGQPLQDATVEVWSDYPLGTVLDTKQTVADGSFEFADISQPIVLRAYATGYFPHLHGTTPPSIGIQISLQSTPAIQASPESMTVSCPQFISATAGTPALPGDVIQAVDADGVICGQFQLNILNSLGNMTVYGDDPTTPNIDEGCETDDIIGIRVNGNAASDTYGPLWASGATDIACYDDTSLGISIGSALGQSTTLSFWAVVNSATPIIDTILVREISGRQVAYNAFGKATWLNLPSRLYVTPRGVACSIDVAGLAAAAYTDTIVVTAPGAGRTLFEVKLTVADLGDTVHFVDAALDSVVRSTLGRPVGDTAPIYLAEAEGITYLNAQASGISDLAGLEHCTGLDTLILSDNSLGDAGIAALSSLNQLRYLNLGNSPATGNNQITDLTVLTGLTNLNFLGLDRVGTGDNLNVVSNLTSLTTLWLDGNAITQVDFLQSLNKLVWLTLRDNSITDLTAFMPYAVMFRNDSVDFNRNPFNTNSVNHLIDSLVDVGVRVWAHYLAYQPDTVFLHAVQNDSLPEPAPVILRDPSYLTWVSILTNPSASDDANWLDLGPLCPTLPCTLMVVPNTTALSAGIHTATITANANAAFNGPVSIPVVYQLDPDSVSPIPAIAGYVYTDTGNSPTLENIVVEAWTGIPTGAVVAADTTDANGRFILHTPSPDSSYWLRAYSIGPDWYYPRFLSSVDGNDTTVELEIYPATPVNPQATWMDVYCDSLTIVEDGRLYRVLPGDIVEARDLVYDSIYGHYRVSDTGTFGIMPVYGDDPFTSGSQGAIEGEQLQFYYMAHNQDPFAWTRWESGQTKSVCFNDTISFFPPRVELDSVSQERGDSLFIGGPGTEIRFVLRLVNPDVVQYEEITAGFRIYSPDGAWWDNVLFDTLHDSTGLGWDQAFNDIEITSSANQGVFADTVGFWGQYGTRKWNLPGYIDQEAFEIRIGPLDIGNDGKTICLDTCFLPPNHSWLWHTTENNGIKPLWDGPHCFTIVDTTTPPIYFPDPALDSAVHEKINRPYGMPIYPDDVDNIATLQIPNRGISDLTGLEHFTGLAYLFADSNSISDLTPLSGLSQFGLLQANYNAITDFVALTGLSQLSALSLSGNPLTTLNPLYSMTSLTSLTLDSCGLVDVTPVGALTLLQSLSLRFNQISNTTPLGTLANLVDLELGYNTVSDLSTIGSLNGLRNLYLEGNNISNLIALQGIDSLTNLNLADNNISDFNALTIHSQLTRLDLSYNTVSSLSPVSAFPALTRIHLEHNQITSIQALFDFLPTSSLQYVYLADNPLDDISVTVYLPFMASTLYHVNSNYIVTNATSLQFNLDSTLTLPPVQNLVIDEAGNAVTLPLLYTKSASWYTISDTAGMSIDTLTVTVTDNTMPPGDYADTLWISSPDAFYSPIPVEVRLHVATGGGPIPINFPDPALDSVIHEKLGKAYGDPIYVSDVDTVTSLYGYTRGIVNLIGLEHFTDLDFLYLYANSIADIGPLGNLVDLDTLYLSYNYVKSIAPLAACTSLTRLYLDRNLVSDLSPLSGHPSLVILQAYSNQISDLSPLSGVTTLSIVALNNNDIVDVSGLLANSGLTGPTDTVYIAGNPLSDTTLYQQIPTLSSRGVYVNTDHIVQSQEVISFTIDSGQANLPADTIILDEAGHTAKLSMIYVLSTPWLAVADTLGVTPDTVVISMTTSDLSPGVHAESLVVSAPVAYDKSITIPITLDVKAPPPAGHITLSRVSHTIGTDLIAAGKRIDFTLRVENQTGLAVNGSANGFRLYSPDGATWSIGSTYGEFIPIDSTAYPGLVWENALPGQTEIYDGGIFVNTFSVDGQGADTIGFSGFSQSGVGMFDGFVSDAWRIQIDSIHASSAGKTICLDSSYYRPAGVWKWSLTGAQEFFPDWDGPHCFTIVDTTTAGSDTIVTFPDPALDSVVHERLGKAYGDTIYASEVSTIDVLAGQQRGIVDLTGLEYFTNIRQLDLWQNNVVDLAPIRSLKTLQSLQLNENNIAYISGLDSLTNLNSLFLNYNNVTDISVLLSLSNIRWLSLESNPIADYSPIANLPQLMQLDLLHDSVSEISFLAGLDSLQWLQLGGTQVTDISILTALASLGYVGLFDTPLSDSAINHQIPALIAQGDTVESNFLVIEPDTVRITFDSGAPGPKYGAYAVDEAGNVRRLMLLSTEVSSLFDLVNVGDSTASFDTIRIVSTHLAPGSYLDSIMIESSDAHYSPVFAYVQIEVTNAPPIGPGTISLHSVTNSLYGTSLQAGVPIEFDIRIANNLGYKALGSSNGFRLYSPDGATWTPRVYVDTNIVIFPPPVTTTMDTTHLGQFIPLSSPEQVWHNGDGISTFSVYDGGIFRNCYDCDGQGSDTIGFAGFVMVDGLGIYHGFDEISFRISLDSIDHSAVGQTICLDSAYYPPSGTWLWHLDTSPSSAVPADWDGPHCFTIVDTASPPPPPALIGVQPNVGSPGDTLDITVTGTATHFVSGGGVTSVSFQQGSSTVMIPSSITANTDTAMVVTLSIPQSEPSGVWNLVVATVLDGTLGLSNAFSVTIPTGVGIAGFVYDNGDTLSPMPGVVVQAFDTLGGVLLDSVLTDSNGAYQIGPLAVTDVVLRAYSSPGYYPTITAASDGDNVPIDLTPTVNVTPTDRYMLIYCGNAVYDGRPIMEHDVIEAVDPDGVVCGQEWVSQAGTFGFLAVNGDDQLTPAIDEGADNGDQIRVKVNGTEVTLNGSVTWVDRAQVEACFGSAAPVPINFPDPALDSVMHEKLGKAYGDPIWLSEVDTIKTLDAQSRGIQSIEGLENLQAISWLWLNNNSVTDISPLGALTAIDWLFLGFNQITDLSALSGLTALTTLYLNDNAIVDLGPLVSNYGLSGPSDVVYLENNPLSVPSLYLLIPSLVSQGVTVYTNHLVTTPRFINFSIDSGATSAPSQSFVLSEAGDSDNLPYVFGDCTSTASWWTMTGASMSIPDTIAVELGDVRFLSPGVYEDSLCFVVTGAYDTLITVSITLQINAPSPPGTNAVSLESVTGSVGPNQIVTGEEISFDLRYQVGSERILGAQNGFRVYSPDGAVWNNVDIDTVSLSSTGTNWINRFAIFIMDDSTHATGSLADTVVFAGIAFTPTGFEPGFDHTALTLTLGPIDPAYAGQTICIDSALWPPNGQWIWSTESSTNLNPSWDGPHCFTIVDTSGFVCGDVNTSYGDPDLGDLTLLLSYVHLGTPDTIPFYRANMDGCDSIDVSDINDLINRLFKTGPPLTCGPYVACDLTGNDSGVADTLAMEITKPPNASSGDSTVELTLYSRSDATIHSMTMGFEWSYPSMTLDTALVSDTVAYSFNLGNFFFEDNSRLTSNANRRALFGGYRSTYDGLPASANRQRLAIYHFTLNNWTEADSIVFDTLKFGPGSTYKAVGPNGAYYPVWAGPVVVRDVNYSAPDINILQPSIGESLTPGQPYLIGWSNLGGFSGNVTIEYSTNAGSSFAPIVTDEPNIGVLPWIVPNEPSGSCRIRVRQAGADLPGIPQDTTDWFRITGLKVMRPNGGEVWYPGVEDTIQWMGPVPEDTSHVDLYLSRNAGASWTYLGRPFNLPQGVSYVPSGPPTAQAVIRAQSILGTIISDQSDSSFTIAGFDLTYPPPGDTIFVGRLDSVVWSSIGNFTSVDLDIRVVDPVSSDTALTNIVTSHPNSSPMFTYMPVQGMSPTNPVGNFTAHMIIRANYGTAADTTGPMVFAQPQLVLTAPDGGESWQIGTQRNITWSHQGFLGDSVIIEFASDYSTGPTWSEVARVSNTDYIYSWSVPNVPSTDCKFRVVEWSSTTGQGYVDESNATFSIIP